MRTRKKGEPIVGKRARSRRRRGKTSVRDANTSDLLTMLSQHGFAPAGFFSPKDREVVLFPEGDDESGSVREHELIHSDQLRDYDPVMGGFSRVQDGTTRRSARRFGRIAKRRTKKGANYGKMARYATNQTMSGDLSKATKAQRKSGMLEYEAIIGSAVKTAMNKIDFNKGYDAIVDQMKAADFSQNRNATHLRNIMTDPALNPRQKKLLLKSIQSKLRYYSK